MKLKLYRVDLPGNRAFSWRVFITLVVLYFLGNLAGVPLLRETNIPAEPVWFWGVVTLVSAIVIALSLVMANRVSLGAPFFAGEIPRDDLPSWGWSGIALTLLIILIGMPFSLIANQNIDPATYPFGWELLSASLKAGVVEEIASRFFLVSLFVWIGKFLAKNDEGRPKPGVYWVSILLSALLFGWAHVDAQLGNPAASFWDYGLLMLISTGLGFYFGWLFFRLGLEWAMIAHFGYDAFVSLVLVPVYLIKNPVVWIIMIAGLIIALVLSWRKLLG